MSSDNEHPDDAGHDEKAKSSISCGNCEKPGHELADCSHLWTSGLSFGYLKGCPMCNTVNHCYDDCKLLPAGGDELLQHHMEWLVRRRRNMPPIYTATDIWILVLGFPDDGCGYPWSRSFTLCLRKRLHLGQGVFGGLHDLKEVATAGDLSDKLTKSLSEIKRHIKFAIPRKNDDFLLAANLVGQDCTAEVQVWDRGDASAEFTTDFKRTSQQRIENTYTYRQSLRRLKVLRARATYPAAFAKESSTWAQAFGDFLLQDKPDGVDDVTALMELRDQAASRAAGQPQSTLSQEQTPKQAPQKKGSRPSIPKTLKRQPPPKQDSPSGSDKGLLSSPGSRAEDTGMISTPLPTQESQTKRASPKCKCSATALEPRTNEKSPTFSSTPLRIRQEIWMALCPHRQCVGGYAFEVPVPPIAQLKAHVIDDLKDNNPNGSTGQRLPLANYIHPHVTVSLVQRERPNGEPVHTLVLGLTDSTTTLRCSRHGLLHAYDMAVCWASRVDKDGVSFSLRSGFDGCHAATERLMGDKMRIEEMAEFEKQIERLAPRCSQFDMVVERIKDWMERSGYKTQHTSREAWSDTLRKWWEDEHDDVGGLDREQLKEACLQAIEAKMKEWKKEKKRAIEEPDSDLEIIESPPKKIRSR